MATDGAHRTTSKGAAKGIRRALLVVTGLALAVGLSVAAGALDVFGDDRPIGPRDALSSLTIYWLLACVAIVLGSGLRHKPRQTSLALLALAGSVLCIEAVLQLSYPPSWRKFRKIPSAEYHHISLPGMTTYWGDVLGTEVFVTTNEDGLRSSRSREEFLAHRHRIVALGDSFTFGHSVRQEKAFPQVMEGSLREALGRDDIAVLNAGQISYSPLLAGRLFEAVVRNYHPTLVIYFLDATDVGDDYSYAKELVHTEGGSHFDLPGASAPRYYGAIGELLGFDGLFQQALKPVHWLAYRTLGIPIPAKYNWYTFLTKINGQVETNRYFIYRHPLEHTRQYFETTFGHIEALAEAAVSVGAEFLLVVVPRYQHWNTDEAPKNWERGSHALVEPYQYEYFRFFRERADEAPFEILSLLTAFRESTEFPLCFEMDPHWNDTGNAFMAAVMADHLIETGRLD